MIRPMFVKDAVCPKCQRNQWCITLDNDEHGEYLDWVCRCGFHLYTQTADAKQEEPAFYYCPNCSRFTGCPGAKDKMTWTILCRAWTRITDDADAQPQPVVKQMPVGPCTPACADYLPNTEGMVWLLCQSCVYYGEGCSLGHTATPTPQPVHTCGECIQRPAESMLTWYCRNALVADTHPACSAFFAPRDECGDENEFLDTKRKVRCTLLPGHTGFHYCQDQTGNLSWTWPNKNDGHTCGECKYQCTDVTEPCGNWTPRDPTPLPCPWCGEVPEIRFNPVWQTWVIKCVNEACPMKPVYSQHGESTKPGEHIAVWNRRAA